jgi:hypothetical protein
VWGGCYADLDFYTAVAPALHAAVPDDVVAGWQVRADHATGSAPTRVHTSRTEPPAKPAATATTPPPPCPRRPSTLPVVLSTGTERERETEVVNPGAAFS